MAQTIARRMRRSANIVVALATSLALGITVQAAFGSENATGDVGPATRAHERPLQEDKAVSTHGITLRVPPSDLNPQISLDEASVIAWREEGATRATDVSGTLAMFANPMLGVEKEKPVWLLTYAGTCVPRFGPPVPDNAPQPDPCAGSDWTVVLDANTGEFIEAYSTGE